MLRSEVPVPAAAVAIRSRAITPSGSRTAALALAGILAVAAGPAGADLLLNEVLYDPLGADDGAEFVELMNPDSLAVPLGGVVVEVCDGARPGAWTPAHVFAPGDTVPARGLYLVAGPSLLVAMQNGPDAVRLTRGGSVLDLLGYGDLAAPELYEGEPAADAASGESLARLRDGVDTEWNASDWAPEPIPTPGRPNHPDVRVAFVPGSVRASPEVSWPGEGVALAAFVKNLGRVEVEGSRWSAEVSIRFGAAASDTTGGSPAGGSAPGDSPWSAEPIATSPGTTLASGESVAVECRFLAPAPGPFALRFLLRDLLAPGAEGVGSNADTGIGSAGWTGSVADTAVVPSRSVAGPLVVNEFAFRDRGFGEWVEILALETVPDIGAFAISDAGGVPRAIERGPVSRGAREGDLIVLAESPALLRSSFALPESVVFGCRGGWPALNDADGASGVADRVRIVGPGGVPSDAAPYGSDSSARGGSLERLSPMFPSASPGTWAESIDPQGGTPGRANSMRAPEGNPGRESSLLVASARSVRREPGAAVVPVVLRLTEAARGRRMRVHVRDLLGRPRRLMLDGQRVSGESAFTWDGRDDRGVPVPPGIYVVWAETLPDGAEPARATSLPLAVVERWPR